MTTPPTDGPGEPSVSTAPPSAPRRWWSAVPHHLGRARTSTVVLALLFVGLYVLYLYVRPPDVPTAPATDGTTVQTPATRTPAETTEPTETTTPATTTPPSPTSAVPSPSAPGEATPSAGTTAATPTTAGQQPTTTRAPTPTVPTPSVAPGT